MTKLIYKLNVKSIIHKSLVKELERILIHNLRYGRENRYNHYHWIKVEYSENYFRSIFGEQNLFNYKCVIYQKIALFLNLYFSFKNIL